MIKPLLYADIKTKKNDSVEERITLSPIESLIHCLNILDLNAAILNENDTAYAVTEKEQINWIELHYTN